MTTLKIEINTGNAAFADGFEGRESARILKQLAEWLSYRESLDGYATRLRDSNGNTVGKVWVEADV
jgi:hypothetical protein